MRPCSSTITPPLVRCATPAALQQALPCKCCRHRLSVTRLLDLLLLVAALSCSLYAIVLRFRFGFTQVTARQALMADLGDLARLQQGLLETRYAFGLRTLRRPRGDIVCLKLLFRSRLSGPWRRSVRLSRFVSC